MLKNIFIESLFKSIMQTRIPTHNHPHNPFNNSIPAHLRRKQPIFNYQPQPQHIYYDTNPYLLRVSPSEPRIRAGMTRLRNQNVRELSDHSSHRSLRVVRVNGLKEVEKPRLVKMSEQHSLRSSHAGQTRKNNQRELELQSQNKMLKEENEGLKDRIRKMEEQKQRERVNLEDEIGHLMQVTQQLQTRMERAEQEWRQQLKKIQESNPKPN